MSVDYGLACTECRVYVWIAQTGATGTTLYSGMPEVMTTLKQFLYGHKNHLLVFVDTQHLNDKGYKEIEPIDSRSRG